MLAKGTAAAAVRMRSQAMISPDAVRRDFHPASEPAARKSEVDPASKLIGDQVANDTRAKARLARNFDGGPAALLPFDDQPILSVPIRGPVPSHRYAAFPRR